MQASLHFLTDFLPIAIWYPSTVTEWKIISIVVMCLISIGLWLQSATDPEERIFWRLTPQRHVEPLGVAELFLAQRRSLLRNGDQLRDFALVSRRLLRVCRRHGRSVGLCCRLADPVAAISMDQILVCGSSA